MPIITFTEVFDIIIMTLFVGFIFSDMVPARREEDYDPLTHYSKWYNFEGLKTAVIATAPAIILHEMAHKFTALGFGLNAVFYAFYHNTFTLMLSLFTIIAKLTGFGFMFFVPGYVGISGQGSQLEFAITALAGPMVNLVLWVIPTLMIKFKKYMKKHLIYLLLTKRINGFLLIFNMLPIPGFDGSKFFTGLINHFAAVF